LGFRQGNWDPTALAQHARRTTTIFRLSAYALTASAALKYFVVSSPNDEQKPEQKLTKTSCLQHTFRLSEDNIKR